jgi:hypothetical protein
MKICLIEPGILPIPCKGWGAVERLAWENYQDYIALGHEVDIVNVPDRNQIISLVNQTKYDVVHVHYDHFYDILSNLQCKLKIITSHYPYINISSQWGADGYTDKFYGIIAAKDTYNFTVSQKDADTFVAYGQDPSRVWHNAEGAQVKSYNFTMKPDKPERTLCLGRILARKRQSLLQNIKSVDFIGPIADNTFHNMTNYKGELDREDLNKTITQYGNLIMLSGAENVTLLVIKEALICGLGVVISECCASELDTSLDFITVIPEDRMTDLSFIESEIKRNRDLSVPQRDVIRQYSVEKFCSLKLAERSLTKVASLL